MTSAHIADPAAPSGFLKSITDEEPVVAAAGAAWLVGNVGNLLATNHVITSTQWSGVAPVATSLITGAVAAVLAWAVRYLVASPKTQRLLQKELDLAKASLANSSNPVVVQVNGQQLAAAVADSAPADEMPAPLTADQLTAAPADPPASTNLTDPATAPTTTDTTGA